MGLPRSILPLLGVPVIRVGSVAAPLVSPGNRVLEWGMATTTAPVACPICGSPTRPAFRLTDSYVTCTRNGHVTNLPEES